MTPLSPVAPPERVARQLGPDPRPDGIDGIDEPTGIAGMVGALDRRVDGWFEPLRGSPVFDTVATVVTGLGDHGLMWAVATAWRARQTGPERARAVRALAIAGVESTLVNAGLKAVVGRSRPDRSSLGVSASGIPVRRPKSSSFPSGHTLAAFCAATVMSRRGDAKGNAVLFTGASLVGVSRLHLRAHYASDVVGGAAVGVVVGLVGRRLL